MLCGWTRNKAIYKFSCWWHAGNKLEQFHVAHQRLWLFRQSIFEWIVFPATINIVGITMNRLETIFIEQPEKKTKTQATELKKIFLDIIYFFVLNSLRKHYMHITGALFLPKTQYEYFLLNTLMYFLFLPFLWLRLILKQILMNRLSAIVSIENVIQ